MKSFELIARRLSSCCGKFGALIATASIFIASPHAASFAAAQTNNSASTQTQQSPQQTPQQQANPNALDATADARQRRASAYAKLLEGQRYLVAARTGVASETSLASARRAFEDALKFDADIAEIHTALAEAAFYGNDIETSERAAKEAVRLDKDNYGGHRQLARIYTFQTGLREGKVDRPAAERAINELREVVRINPNDGEAHTLLAELYQATERDAEAIESFRRAAAAPALTDPRFLQALTGRRDVSPDASAVRLAEALIRAGRSTEAIEAVRRAIASDPTSERNLALLGSALDAGINNPQPVITELQRAVTIDPNNLTAINTLARAQAMSNQVDAAAKTLRDAIARRATNESANERELFSLRLNLANTFADALRYDEARAAYDEILAKRNIENLPLTNTTDKEIAGFVVGRIVNLERQANRFDEARSAIERLRVLLGESDSSADELLVALLRETGKRQEALTATRAARVRFPNNDVLQRHEAQTLAELGKVDEGVAILRGRLTNTSDDYQEYLYIANTYLQAGRGREAVEAARKAVELAPQNRPDLTTQALVLLSSAQERAGDTKGSEESLRSILARQPNNAMVLNNLGYFLVERNERLPEALELIQRAVRAEPFNASFLDSLGWAYFKLNRLDEAERNLTEAARRSPSSATIQEHLGDVLKRLGRADQARAAWRKALTLSVEAEESARLKDKLNKP